MNDLELLLDLKRRIEQLELAERRRPIIAKAPSPVEPPKKFIEEGATVRHLAASAAVEMPDDTQLAALQRLVLDRYPVLRAKISSRFAEQDQSEFDQHFRSAFRALAAFPRISDLDIRLATVNWIDRCEDVLRSMPRAETASMKLQPLTVAVLCWGDIPHSFDPSRFPYDLSFGLAHQHGTGRMPTADSWRNVLATKKLLELTELPAAKTSQSRSLVSGPTW
jgi:hypothetical protein